MPSSWYTSLQMRALSARRSAKASLDVVPVTMRVRSGTVSAWSMYMWCSVGMSWSSFITSKSQRAMALGPVSRTCWGNCCEHARAPIRRCIIGAARFRSFLTDGTAGAHLSGARFPLPVFERSHNRGGHVTPGVCMRPCAESVRGQQAYARNCSSNRWQPCRTASRAKLRHRRRRGRLGGHPRSTSGATADTCTRIRRRRIGGMSTRP